MKSTKLVLFALVSLSLPSFGALYTLNNGTGTTASGIETLSGATFRAGTASGDAFTGTNLGTSAGPGVLAIGIFSTDSLATLTGTQLVSSFTQFGAAGAFAGASTTGQRSIFSLPTSDTVTGTTFSNKNIYLFAGNGATLATSTQFLVLKTTTLFTDAQDALPTALTVTVRPDATSTALFGTTNANVWTTNSDAITTAGWTMAAPVPEPSAALLGALGALGLLRRRRN
jgi:MYXO-CTERM domain-containing protein